MFINKLYRKNNIFLNFLKEILEVILVPLIQKKKDKVKQFNLIIRFSFYKFKVFE